MSQSTGGFHRTIPHSPFRIVTLAIVLFPAAVSLLGCGYMIGSAYPSLSGAYVSGLQGSLDTGPTASLPARRPYSRRRALDAPLGRRDLARRLEPATWLSGDYQGGTLTRKFDTACAQILRVPTPGGS